LIYYTVKHRAVLTFLVCPSGGLYTKLTKEYNINSTFIGLCLQYWSVFPVCADWLLFIDLWHPNWRAARNHHRVPCRFSFTQRACSQARKLQTSQGYIIRTLQHFATKLWSITNFVMLFQAMMKLLSRITSKFSVLRKWSIEMELLIDYITVVVLYL
jgi:hypothetical protein